MKTPLILALVLLLSGCSKEKGAKPSEENPSTTLPAEAKAGLSNSSGIGDKETPAKSQQTPVERAGGNTIGNGLPIKIRHARTAITVVPNFSLADETLHYLVVELQMPWTRLPIVEGPENMKSYAGFANASPKDQLYRFRAVSLMEFSLTTTGTNTYECFALGRQVGGEAWAMASGGKWYFSGTDEANRVPAMVRLVVNGKVPAMTSYAGTSVSHSAAFIAYDDPDEAVLLAFVVPKTVPLEQFSLRFSADKPVLLTHLQR
jgi:hypothetical protein